MRIVHLAAGAGAMYCGACARDVAMARGLLARGHDVQIVPLYTPLRIDGAQSLRTSAVYLGGINAYLQQASVVFRLTPAFIDRLFDNEALLRWASRFAVKTRPQDLGPMTQSVLQGRDGRQRKELDRLVRYLKTLEPPDVVSITNSMLSGVAPEIKRRLNARVVCGLQGEDTFVNSLPDPYRALCWELMRTNAQSVDRFIAPCDAHADTMARSLGIDRARISVVRTGIDAARFQAKREPNDGPFRIAYVSALIPGKGLDLLLSACAQLRDTGRSLSLQVVGKVLDEQYARDIHLQIQRMNLNEVTQLMGELDFDAKLAVLCGSDVFVMPTRIAESRAVAAMEAMACATPIIAPRIGVFPELLAQGGGVLYPVDDASALAQAILQLMDDRSARLTMGATAAQVISRDYTLPEMAKSYEAALGIEKLRSSL